MPGGLPGVEQSFSADASGYVAAVQEMIRQNRDLIKSIGEVNAAIGLLKDKSIRITADNGGAMRGIAEVQAALDGLHDKEVTVAVKYVTTGDRPDGGGVLGGDSAAMIRELRDISASMDQATSSMGRMEDHMGVISKNAQDSSADLMMQTQILRDNADAHNAAATAAGALAAAQGRGRGGGGGGGALAAAAGAAAGAGGGGGGFGPFTLSGSAGTQADAVVGFVRRWYSAVHWAMMATNEILATVGPAAVAAGAAAMVGWQGVEQMRSRFTAISATAESLGPAYGKTLGSYLGTGSALQNYQNLATGGVYELGGAGINLARQGGGAFGQTGLNTIAMLDRGVANMQINMQNRGTMGTLSGLLGGGTGYLRQFGDIGANLGNIFLGLAPHLPGVGGDYLSALEGVTGGLAGGFGFLNQHHLGDVLGLGLAGEAGARVGTPLVGLLGKLLQSGGLKLAGLGGDSLLGEAGLGIGGLGEGLMALGGPEVAALAMSAFMGSKLVSSMPSSSQRQMDALQQQVYGKGGFTSPWQALGGAVTTATGLAAGAPASGMAAIVGANQSPGFAMRFGPQGQTQADIYRNAASGFSQTMGNLINSGPQLQAALQKAGMKGVSMADAFQIAQNSLLDLSHAFDSHGKLTKTAQQMLTNYVSTIGPMTQSAGGFNAAIGAQQIMSSPAMQNLSKVNQAMDSMTQIMSGTNLGASGLAGSIGSIANPKALASALSSVTTAGSGAAWNTFAGTGSTPGLITQLQSFNDQMRTNLTLGSSTLKQAQGMTGYEIQQTVGKLGPGLAKDPAALAMLMQQAAQQGIGGYYQGGAGDAAKNYAALEKSLKGAADSAKQMNADSTAATIKNSQIPTLAKQFVQGTGAQIQSQQIAKAAQDAMNIKGGINIKANVADLVSQLKAAGVTGGAALKASLDAVLQQAGVGKAMRVKIEAQVMGGEQIAALRASMAAVHSKVVHADVTGDYKEVQRLNAEMARMHDKLVHAKANADYSQVAALNAQINALHDKVVTITTRMITVGGMGITAGIPVGVRAPGMSVGGMVPGFGSGDHIPALLEPGEAIVPRYLVPLIAPILKSHHVPGFAAGGIVPAGTLAGVNSQIGSEWKILDQMYAGNAPKSQISAFWNTILDPLYKAKDAFASVSKSAASSAASTKAATAAATALANKFTTAMNYARGVSGAASAGQGFGNTGLLSGVDTTQTTVGQYMTDYLTSETGFTKDLGTLTKGGLNKSLIQQLVAAGPVQGDLLAQSILQQGGTTGAAGGISSINKLWSQIGTQSHALGAQAAMSVYGQTIAPNLKSGTVTSNNISINVNVPGGAGANLNLTPAQVKVIVEAVQAALLKQARRNNRTGIQATGKGA